MWNIVTAFWFYGVFHNIEYIVIDQRSFPPRLKCRKVKIRHLQTFTCMTQNHSTGAYRKNSLTYNQRPQILDLSYSPTGPQFSVFFSLLSPLLLWVLCSLGAQMSLLALPSALCPLFCWVHQWLCPLPSVLLLSSSSECFLFWLLNVLVLKFPFGSFLFYICIFIYTLCFATFAVWLNAGACWEGSFRCADHSSLCRSLLASKEGPYLSVWDPLPWKEILFLAWSVVF